MQELVWALLAVLLFAVILTVGFNTTLKDFLTTKIARNLLFSGIVCLGLFLLGIGTVVTIQAKTDYDVGSKVCRTTVYNENLVEIGEEELIEGVNIPVYDKTFANIERDKCLKEKGEDFIRKAISGAVIFLIGIASIIVGVLALCGKIWTKGKKKAKKR